MADDATSTETSTTDAPETVTETPTSDAGTSALNGGGETTDATTTEAKEGESPAVEAQVVPEAYDLTAPEGFTLDADAIAAATPVFKELGLSNEAANKLMPAAAQFAQGLADKMQAGIEAQVAADRKAWLDTARADPEIGGAQWDATLATAAKGLDRLGFTTGTPFRKLLDESGLGNHPDMIRAWKKVGDAIGEDPSFVRPGHSAPAETNAARLLYPNDAPKGA